MDTKTCPRCNISKPKTEFSKDSSKSDKLFYCCKSCDKLANTQWRKYNREHLNNYKKDKYKNDEAYRLALNLRTRLRQALLKQVTHNNSKIEELLGISIKEFKKYIEFLMSPEMTWESIDLDHIVPLSSFDLTNPEQLKQATHYTNIQPLLKSDNRAKGANYHEHDLAVQNEKLYEYEYFKYYLN